MVSVMAPPGLRAAIAGAHPRRALLGGALNHPPVARTREIHGGDGKSSSARWPYTASMATRWSSPATVALRTLIEFQFEDNRALRLGWIGLVEMPHPVECDINIADEREELEVEGDLTLNFPELIGVPASHEAAVQVTPALAGPDEQIRSLERLLELLHRIPRLRLLHQWLSAAVELPQKVADHLDPPCELLARSPVPPYRLRRLRDHLDQAVGVYSGELRDGGGLRNQSHLAAFVE
uniref:Uncharacterized protein n=1 Tax=Leersia perrieri TaxID=77586 RepID=A0A0D9XV80_9ORYZ